MPLLIALLVAASLLGFGALQEFWIRGIEGRELQPLVVGAAGTLVSFGLAGTAIALRRQRAPARRLALWTAAGVSSFHVYAALPPHRYVGFPALLMALFAAGLLVTRAIGDTRGAPGQHRDPAI